MLDGPGWKKKNKNTKVFESAVLGLEVTLAT